MPAKYVRLAEQLKKLILQNTGGEYKLPSEHKLCGQYHVSRQTVRAALRLLAQEGLIEKRPGSGSFSTGLGAMKNEIAIIVNNAEEYTTPALLADIKSALHEKRYTLSVYSTGSRIAAERQILTALTGSSIRGMIVEGTRCALPNPNLDLYERLRQEGTAILFLGGHYPTFPAGIYIRDDNYYGGYLLAKHLIRGGHTRIGGIFRIDELQGLERYHGFMAALRDFGIPADDERIVWYASPELEALEERSDTGFLTGFLRRQARLCSALICQNDEIAYWLIRELQYGGIRVPDEISVVSFDNSYLSELSAVRITSLSHPPHEPGNTAARTLLRMIQGQTVLPEELPWSLIAKDSDAPCTEAPLI